MISENSAHRFELEGIGGGSIRLADFAGRKILVVNTASACGYTPQYRQLEELHENFADKLVVLGIPCNDFGQQEPGSETEIAQFCLTNFGVNFPMTKKMNISDKATRHPLYSFLTNGSANDFGDSEVIWNFQKYLLDESGKLIAIFSPQTEPLSEEVLQKIEG